MLTEISLPGSKVQFHIISQHIIPYQTGRDISGMALSALVDSISSLPCINDVGIYGANQEKYADMFTRLASAKPSLAIHSSWQVSGNIVLFSSVRFSQCDIMALILALKLVCGLILHRFVW